MQRARSEDPDCRVYRLTEGGPELTQLLPSGVSPEGAVAIPARDLLVTANEVDLVEDGGARAHVMLYALQDAEVPDYPSIALAEDAEILGWGALSGLAADPDAPGRLHAVSDSVYDAEPRIFEIDATATPARITRAIDVTRGGVPARKLDLEGIAPDGEGGFWLASEGDRAKLVPHALIHVDAEGAIEDEIAFPDELAAAETRFGAEGVAVIDGRIWVAVQREWGDDRKGEAKLLAYDPGAETWGGVRYPLDAAPEGGWIGLSEITAAGGYAWFIERDNRIGATARVKQITRVALSAMEPAPLDGALPLVTKEVFRDLLPDLAATGGYVADKIEGFAIDAAGEAYAVTDNDGVDDSSGETHFLRLGRVGARSE